MPAYIYADSRRMWRVVENLFNNIVKYAMEGTRVYIEMSDLSDGDGKRYVEFSLKNISAQPLNINADELTERFIRGDVARSTEGSGLGLSIAKNGSPERDVPDRIGRRSVQSHFNFCTVIKSFLPGYYILPAVRGSSP